ncbi:MAG: hypothetical protein AB7N76_14345 [Planctomycetota bacterium]
MSDDPQPTGYSPDLTLREARTDYFARNGFGEGGYEDRWVRLQAGPLVFFIPNTAGRVRAVRYHDLHHVLTEYPTTWTGEAEIGAWEVASGCADHYAAWFLNLSAMAVGLVIAPARTYEAFARGHGTRNLYREPFGDELLAARVGETRARLGLDRPAHGDHALSFALWSVAAISTWLVPFLGGLAVLAGLVWLWRGA